MWLYKSVLALRKQLPPWFAPAPGRPGCAWWWLAGETLFLSNTLPGRTEWSSVFLPSQRGSCLVFLSQPSSDRRVERRKLALAVQQVSGFCLASAPLRRCRCGERLRSASVLYSASEHLCSLSVVKTVNTGVTQRINGNDRRIVLLDKQDFPHTPPPPAPRGWKRRCPRAAANKHLYWTGA